jgi:hypothetical protein
MKDLIKQIEALKLKDDRNGLKQNALIDKVIEVVKNQEPCDFCNHMIDWVGALMLIGGKTNVCCLPTPVTANYCPNCGRLIKEEIK